MSSTSLKQLQPLVDQVATVTRASESLLTYTNNHIPASLKPTVEACENKIAALTQPLLNTASTKAAPLLEKLDTQVDSVVKGATAVYDSQMEFHAQNLQQFKAAREASLEKVRAIIDFLKEKGLSGSVQTLLDAVSNQLASVRALPSYVNEKAHTAFAGLQSAYQQLLEHPTVARVMKTAKPTVDFAVAKYMGVHDAVVATGTYKFAYDKSVSLLGYAQSTSVFQYASKSLYPYVAPYADPALNSTYYQQLLDHVKPTTL